MNKLRNLIESLGLNYKNQILFFILINVITIAVGIVAFIFFNNPVVISFVFVFLVLIDYVYLSRYKTLQKTKNLEVTSEFISLLPFFKTYIQNGFSVYQTFKNLIPFCNSDLQDRLILLIEMMDNDKTVTPFIEFARKFNSTLIEQLSLTIFQMIDEGNESAHFLQFEVVFSKLIDDEYKNELIKKSNSLGSMTSFPLIGSGLLIVMITFGILSVIGDMINGI